MSDIKLTIINGGSRPESRSRKVARFIESAAKSTGHFEITFVDVADYHFEHDGLEKDERYTKIVDQTDVFFIVFPEYNRSFPGKLKTLLDSEYGLYKGKPVALCSVSNGQFGGTRAMTSLLPVVVELGMLTPNIQVHVPMVNEVLDENGVVTEPKVIENIEKALNRLVELTY